MNPKVLWLAVCVALVSTSLQAAPVERTTLGPIDHSPAQLVVVDPDGNEFVYTQADLEALGSYRLSTTTPWRNEAAMFEGGLLQDLLKRHGLDVMPAIRVTAENEFETVLERTVWDNVPVLLATRVDGQPHSRRARGPIQFVVSADDYSSEFIAERHLVWMAARIEPVR